MELKDKYIFKPYSSVFPNLFDTEKKRLEKLLGNNVPIEHIGSTAVPGLGGKGVVDILIVRSKNNWPEVSEKLISIGYEYKKKDVEREKEKLFFMTNLPDKELGTRIYHIHLSYPESPEVKRNLGFRNYLISHPDDAREYAEIKKRAAQGAQKFSTKDKMHDTYGKIKEAFIQKILNKI